MALNLSRLFGRGGPNQGSSLVSDADEAADVDESAEVGIEESLSGAQPSDPGVLNRTQPDPGWDSGFAQTAQQNHDNNSLDNDGETEVARLTQSGGQPESWVDIAGPSSDVLSRSRDNNGPDGANFNPKEVSVEKIEAESTALGSTPEPQKWYVPELDSDSSAMGIVTDNKDPNRLDADGKFGPETEAAVLDDADGAGSAGILYNGHAGVGANAVSSGLDTWEHAAITSGQDGREIEPARLEYPNLATARETPGGQPGNLLPFVEQQNVLMRSGGDHVTMENFSRDPAATERSMGPGEPGGLLLNERVKDVESFTALPELDANGDPSGFIEMNGEIALKGEPGSNAIEFESKTLPHADGLFTPEVDDEVLVQGTQATDDPPIQHIVQARDTGSSQGVWDDTDIVHRSAQGGAGPQGFALDIEGESAGFVRGDATASIQQQIQPETRAAQDVFVTELVGNGPVADQVSVGGFGGGVDDDRVKWEGPDFDTSKNEVSIESIEVAHEGVVAKFEQRGIIQKGEAGGEERGGNFELGRTAGPGNPEGTVSAPLDTASFTEVRGGAAANLQKESHKDEIDIYSLRTQRESRFGDANGDSDVETGDTSLISEVGFPKSDALTGNENLDFSSDEMADDEGPSTLLGDAAAHNGAREAVSLNFERVGFQSGALHEDNVDAIDADIDVPD